MGTNTLVTKSDGEVISDSDVNQYKTALNDNVVPRNASGVATDQAGSIGTSSLTWSDSFSQQYTIGTPANGLIIAENGSNQMSFQTASTERVVIDANGLDGAGLKDDSVTSAKIGVVSRFMPVGSVTMFHSFNSAVSIPRGWMSCDGNIINQTNYDALHGAGSYVADGVGSSALAGKYLPSMGSRYPVGTTNTTQTGGSSITTVGNTSHQVNLQHSHTVNSHNHWVYDATSRNTFTSGGASTNVSAGSTATSYISANGTNALITDLYTNNQTPGTDNQLSTTQSVQPESIEFLFILKVV